MQVTSGSLNHGLTQGQICYSTKGAIDVPFVRGDSNLFKILKINRESGLRTS
jgi:hypothetical protein